jgi:NAD-dependent dihydropyrimidine dehydrogenase PreA subunit
MDELKSFARKLRATHCMFATSETFKNIYSIEISLWDYGMPMAAYNDMLDIYHLSHIPLEPVRSSIIRKMEKDIPDLGTLGITIMDHVGVKLRTKLDGCIACGKCVEECPEKALEVIQENGLSYAIISSERCAGTACRRCELVCPQKTINLKGARAED